tara:strand:+ start:446 stop:811 length:366 start_codon:yes stop_codon:yes gene_type:complete
MVVQRYPVEEPAVQREPWADTAICIMAVAAALVVTRAVVAQEVRLQAAANSTPALTEVPVLVAALVEGLLHRLTNHLIEELTPQVVAVSGCLDKVLAEPEVYLVAALSILGRQGAGAALEA